MGISKAGYTALLGHPDPESLEEISSYSSYGYEKGDNYGEQPFLKDQKGNDLSGHIQVVFTAMGEPSDSEAGANCADLGMGINNYYYDGRVFIQIADTTGTVTQIFISDPIIDCGGVAVGDSVDAVTSVYGEPSFQSEFIVEYKKDGMTLQFELENGKVSKIWYLENATVE
jgi:hypothetical protein